MILLECYVTVDNDRTCSPCGGKLNALWKEIPNETDCWPYAKRATAAKWQTYGMECVVVTGHIYLAAMGKSRGHVMYCVCALACVIACCFFCSRDFILGIARQCLGLTKRDGGAGFIHSFLISQARSPSPLTPSLVHHVFTLRISDGTHSRDIYTTWPVRDIVARIVCLATRRNLGNPW